MAGVFKKTTCLTGLAVNKNPQQTLNTMYKQILNLLTKMPEGAAYRKHTEEIIKHKSYIVNSTDDIKVMEEKLASGQIEEVITQAKKELELVRYMLVARPWETLQTPIPKNQWKWPAK